MLHGPFFLNYVENSGALSCIVVDDSLLIDGKTAVEVSS